MPLEAKRIGENIGQYMKAHHITVRQASERSGFAISTISEITNGKDKKLSYYFILAKAINMPQQQLFATQYAVQDIALLELINNLTNQQKQHLKDFLSSIS